MPVGQSFCTFVCLSPYLSGRQSVCVSVGLSIRLSACVCVGLSLCVYGLRQATFVALIFQSFDDSRRPFSSKHTHVLLGFLYHRDLFLFVGLSVFSSPEFLVCLFIRFCASMFCLG